MGNTKKEGVGGQGQGTHFLLNEGPDKDTQSAQGFLRENSQLF